jgi:hypothetical protein
MVTWLVSNRLLATGLVTATLGSFGPHVTALGYQLAGARVPAAILYFCPLHHGSGVRQPAVVRGSSVEAIR